MYAFSAVEIGKTGYARRLLVFAALALGELLLISFSFNFATGLPEWMNPVAYAKGLAQAGFLAVAALAVILWPRRAEILRSWSEAAPAHRWRASIAINLGLLAVVYAATLAFSSLAAHASSPPWAWFALYCCLLLTLAVSLGLVAAPAAFWRRLVAAVPMQLGVALLSAGLLVVAGRLSLESWGAMSEVTLNVSHWILTLYETDVFLDVPQKILGAGDFRVLILRECSGYEGIGLVVAFLALYCCLMRHRLRFPHALLLFPIAIAAVWTLNALRIALLVSIGAHVSPEIALNGFHSQAGWIGFLAVGFAIMAASSRMAFFRADRQVADRQVRAAHEGQTEADRRNRLQLALLVPFMALMAAGILESLFTPHGQWLYVVKVVAVTAALWWYRDVYAGFASAVSPLSLAVGIAVGAVWIATAPQDDGGANLGLWLASLPAWAAAVWMACRALGAIVLVPVTEELAFRGYLQRLLVGRDFWKAAPGQFTWLSFLVTSALFGLMHERWVAATLAGAIYALLLYRSNRLSDAIAAHMASNAVIVAWAIATEQWSLL